jgi:hypothetical protein
MYRILATATLLFICGIANADCGSTCNDTMQVNSVGGLVGNNATEQYGKAHELFVGEWQAPLEKDLIVTWNTVNGGAYTFEEAASPYYPRGIVSLGNGIIWQVNFDNDGRTMHLRNPSTGWGRIYKRMN